MRSFLAIFLLTLSIATAAIEKGKNIFISRSWMKIDELLDEAEGQSNIKIQSMITDTEEKMVLYDSLTRLDHVLEAAKEYYEYVLRLEVEVIYENRKIIIRKPMVIEVEKEKPMIFNNWPAPAQFEKLNLIIGKEFVMKAPKSHLGFSDMPIESGLDQANSKTERKLLNWREFLFGVIKDRSKVRAGDYEESGYVLIKSREIDQNFKMIPDENNIALLKEEGWTVEKIDKLFKPSRVKEKIISSTIDGIVYINAIKEDLWLDLMVIGEEKKTELNVVLNSLDSSNEAFGLGEDLDFTEENLPSHPKDPKRKPKWLMSLSFDKWFSKLEPYRHAEEKVEPISKRVLRHKDRSQAIFDDELEAYYKMRTRQGDGLSRRQKRN